MQGTRRRQERMRVVVRIRPFVKEERPTANIWKLLGNNTLEHNIGEESWQQVGRREELQAFAFDRVFDETASTKEVYSAIVNRERSKDASAKDATGSSGEMVQSSMIHNLLDGVHGCIMAYGPTSCGKTYNIFGGHSTNTAGLHSLSAPGILPLVLDELFAAIETRCPNGEMEKEYLVRCSYLEIYNETISDLFAKVDAPENEKKGDRRGPSSTDKRGSLSRSASGRDPGELLLKEHHKKGFYIHGLKEAIVTSSREVLDMMKKADKGKHVSRTRWNEKSSRAHALFTVIVESMKEPKTTLDSANKEDKYGAISGKLHIVDLAGSERLQAHGHHTKQHTISDEGRKINQSLFFLSEVISKLAGSEKHIPYRDSKLTRILASSLGGNALTSLLICLSPAPALAPQSLAALRFGQKAKMITSTIIPQQIPCERSVILKIKERMVQLEAQLKAYEAQDAKNSKHCADSDLWGTPARASSRNRRRADLESQIYEASRHILRSGGKRRYSPMRSPHSQRSSRHSALSEISPSSGCLSSFARAPVPLAPDLRSPPPVPDFAAMVEQLHDDFGNVHTVVHDSHCTRHSVVSSSLRDRTYWAGLLAAQCVHAAIEKAVRAHVWEAQRVEDAEANKTLLKQREESWDKERRVREQETRILTREQDEERTCREQQEALHDMERQKLQGCLAEEMTARGEDLRVLEEYCSVRIGELEENYALLEQHWTEEAEAQRVQHAIREDEWIADAEQKRAAQEEETLRWKMEAALQEEIHENIAREWQSESARMEETREARAAQWKSESSRTEELHAEHARQWAADTLQLCEMHQAEIERSIAEQTRSTLAHNARLVEREETWQAELSAQSADAHIELLSELGAVRDNAFNEQRAQSVRFEHKLREVELAHKSKMRIAEEKLRQKNADLRSDLDVARRLHEARVASLEETNVEAKNKYEAELQHLTEALALASDKEKIEESKIMRESLCKQEEEWKQWASKERKKWLTSLEAARAQAKEENRKAIAAEERCAAWQTEYAALLDDMKALERQSEMHGTKRQYAEYRVTHLESTLALERQMKRATDDDVVQKHMLDHLQSIRNSYHSPRTQRSPRRQATPRNAYTDHMQAYLRTLSKNGY